MLFLYISYPFDTLSLEIDLRNCPRLRLLQLNLRLDSQPSRKLQGDVIRWLDSICESVTSNSLVVEVHGFRRNLEICSEIEDMFLALYERVDTLLVYLPRVTEAQGFIRKNTNSVLRIIDTIYKVNGHRIVLFDLFVPIHTI